MQEGLLVPSECAAIDKMHDRSDHKTITQLNADLPAVENFRSAAGQGPRVGNGFMPTRIHTRPSRVPLTRLEPHLGPGDFSEILVLRVILTWRSPSTGRSIASPLRSLNMTPA